MESREERRVFSQLQAQILRNFYSPISGSDVGVITQAAYATDVSDTRRQRELFSKEEDGGIGETQSTKQLSGTAGVCYTVIADGATQG